MKTNRIGRTPAALGPWAIISLRFSNHLKDNPLLKADFKYFIILQIISLGIAIISGFLGYSRSFAFFSGFDHPEIAAILVSSFIAGAAYFTVSHVGSRLAFILMGGVLPRGEWAGLILSLIIAVLIVSLDSYINKEGITPATYTLTKAARQSEAGQIIGTYDGQIEQAQERVASLEKRYFTYKGKVHIPTRPTRWHSQQMLDEYAAATSTLSSLQTSKASSLANDTNAVKTDATRHLNEINSKEKVLSLFIWIMYGIMLLVSIRASMYGHRVLDYLEQNPLGDIPGDQQEHYGEKTEGSKKEIGYQQPGPNAADNGGKIGFKMPFQIAQHEAAIMDIKDDIRKLVAENDPQNDEVIGELRAKVEQYESAVATIKSLLAKK
ncbi:MAG: hypothetical protein AAF206_17335 [Bacteroidota bacterium]